MKSTALKTLLGVLLLGSSALLASAQTTPITRPNLDKLGPELKAIIEQHRDAAKLLLAERKTTLEQLKLATTPEEKEKLKLALREIMREHQQDQRDLARAVRDAIKARRDQQRTTGT